MTDSQRYTAALAFASKKHSGQLRIGGDPYITHPAAVVASDDFKRRYIRETADWYLDLSPEILPALKALAQTMDTGLAAPDFLCDPVGRWPLQQK